MPQYKQTQYGLKQYGIFQSGGVTPEIKGHWQFVRSRFGLRRNGRTFWLYQHTPVSIQGKVTRLRIQTNQGETLYQKNWQVDGVPKHLRLRANNQSEAIESIALTMKGAET